MQGGARRRAGCPRGTWFGAKEREQLVMLQVVLRGEAGPAGVGGRGTGGGPGRLGAAAGAGRPGFAGGGFNGGAVARVGKVLLLSGMKGTWDVC